MQSDLSLSPAVSDREGVRRASAEIAGAPLWFEWTGIAPGDVTEALASALLMPAAAAGRRLAPSRPVQDVWLANVERMMETWHQWWGYPVLTPRAEARREPRPRAPGAALCFTGGVDSFHALLDSPQPPELLTYVHGYDIALHDRPRMAAWEACFREIADAVGAEAVLLRSNLREHPLSETCPWDRAHGGGLAAVGHLLAERVGTLRIASSWPRGNEHPWGSHWDLDPLWSSDRLLVEHVGEDYSRLQKVRVIVGHGLAQRHLRVCWENLAPTGNCSSCDKCLNTMTLLAACGEPERFTTFDWSHPLAKRIDRLERTRFRRGYAAVLESGLDRRLACAVRSLLERTGAAARDAQS